MAASQEFEIFSPPLYSGICVSSGMWYISSSYLVCRMVWALSRPICLVPTINQVMLQATPSRDLCPAQNYYIPLINTRTGAKNLYYKIFLINGFIKVAPKSVNTFQKMCAKIELVATFKNQPIFQVQNTPYDG